MLECARVALRPGHPFVGERDAGEIEPRFRGVHHAGQAGKGQVAAQNAVRPAPFQSGEELLRAGHLTTVAHAYDRGVMVHP